MNDMDLKKINLDSRRFHCGYNRGSAKLKIATDNYSAGFADGQQVELDNNELSRSAVSLSECDIREMDDRSLNGRKVGRTDADKLRIINEVLRRKGTIKTHAHIVRRWLSERGLLTTSERTNNNLD